MPVAFRRLTHLKCEHVLASKEIRCSATNNPALIVTTGRDTFRGSRQQPGVQLQPVRAARSTRTVLAVGSVGPPCALGLSMLSCTRPKDPGRSRAPGGCGPGPSHRVQPNARCRHRQGFANRPGRSDWTPARLAATGTPRTRYTNQPAARLFGQQRPHARGGARLIAGRSRVAGRSAGTRSPGKHARLRVLRTRGSAKQDSRRWHGICFRNLREAAFDRGPDGPAICMVGWCTIQGRSDEPPACD
jgi:hypothetical protein